MALFSYHICCDVHVCNPTTKRHPGAVFPFYQNKSKKNNYPLTYLVFFINNLRYIPILQTGAALTYLNKRKPPA